MRIQEIPIDYQRRLGDSKIRLKHLFMILRTMWRDSTFEESGKGLYHEDNFYYAGGRAFGFSIHH